MINSSDKKGAQVMSAEFSWPRLRIQSAKLRKMVEMKSKRKKTKRGLFVFPLHSRMTGARYPYLWMNIAKENGWHILIDACALGPKDMDSFGLSLIRPDFLICSFYKIFGENPSGFGCLFVKKSTVPLLEDSVSAGMVSLVPANKMFRLVDEFSGTDSDFEHLSKLGLQEDELDSSNSFSGPISSQTMHSGRVEQGETSESQTTGTTALAFNLFDWKGEKVEAPLVQKLADRSNISLSYGFLHHISFSDEYEEEKATVLEKRVNGAKGTVTNKRKEKADFGITVVTVALGVLANFEDTYRFWAFIAQFLDADFVEKAKWRYTALNQKTVEV